MQIREENKNALKSLFSPDPKDINIGKVIVNPSITNKAPKIFKRLLISSSYDMSDKKLDVTLFAEIEKV